MKMNSTLAAVLIFVLVMLGSGLVSGLKAYTLGYEALKEISQPNVKTAQKDFIKEKNQSVKNEQMIVSEANILEKVNAKMNRSQDKAVPLDGNQASQKNNQKNNQNSFIESP